MGLHLARTARVLVLGIAVFDSEVAPIDLFGQISPAALLADRLVVFAFVLLEEFVGV